MSDQVVGISDVSLGFGSPQIPCFMQYILSRVQGAKGIVLEPDQPEKPYERYRYVAFETERIFTQADVYSANGRSEYIRSCAKKVNRQKPDILILFCSFTLPVLFALKYLPKKVIYYNIEMASAYGRADEVLNTQISGKAGLLIYPERNRAMLDIHKFGFQGIPSVVVMNCTNQIEELQEVVPVSKRNGKVIYSGRLDYVNTNAAYFLGDDIREFQIDIFGNIAGERKEYLRKEFVKLNSKVRYFGYIEGEKLKSIRKEYAYSIVMWNPVNENQYYAAPNKFFEAIADGVIPICTPHPQCTELIQKYDCGILMEDWSYDAFAKALRLAEKLYGSERYRELVEHCREAVVRELSWEKQMEKVDGVLRFGERMRG